jgi:hypothetical protein
VVTTQGVLVRTFALALLVFIGCKADDKYCTGTCPSDGRQVDSPTVTPDAPVDAPVDAAATKCVTGAITGTLLTVTLVDDMHEYWLVVLNPATPTVVARTTGETATRITTGGATIDLGTGATTGLIAVIVGADGTTECQAPIKVN